MIRHPIGHVATRLLREIGELVRIGPTDRQKPTIIIEEIRAIDWASVTFVGQRHELDLRLEGERGVVAAALMRLQADLVDHDIAIAGHFIADIRVIPGDPGAAASQADGECRQPLTIEALVLRD